MLIRIIVFLVILFVSACGTFESDATKTQLKIQHDLRLKNIVGLSKINYCSLPISTPERCKTISGIAVLAENSLIITDYMNGAYRKRETFSKNNIMCIAAKSENDFYIFTKEQAVLIYPSTQGADSSSEFRSQVINTLFGRGRPYLVNEAASTTWVNDREILVTTNVNISGSNIAIPNLESFLEITNPCRENE